MFKIMINILKKPQLSFTKIKDKTRKSIFYILLLSLIMTIPIFILAFVNKNELVLNQNGLKEVSREFSNNNLEITDGKLVNPNNYNNIYVINNIYLSVGSSNQNLFGYLISLEEEGISIYMRAGISNVLVSSSSYKTLGYENLDFTNNANLILSMINKQVSYTNTLVIFKVTESFTANFFDLLFVVLLLALLAKVFTGLPISFKEHFNINTYVATSYGITYLLLDLFNIGHLNIVAVIIAYIYQTIAYKSVRIISNIKVGNKDE